MEWPYDHPRRGDMPPGHHALTLNEYNIRQPPYAARIRRTRRSTRTCRAGAAPTTQEHRRQRKGPPVHRHELRVGARARAWAARRTSGDGWRCASPTTTSRAKSRDGYGEDWPISYKDIEPYYDRVDQYLGISGVKENLPHLPDSIFQRPTRLNAAEVTLRNSLKKMDRVLTPYRAGVTTDGLKHNKYRSRCFGRGACNRRVGRLRHPRGVRLADRPDLSGDGHRAT